MTQRDDTESLARNLASIVLHDPQWRDSLDERCAALVNAASRIKPVRKMTAVVKRAEAILRHVAEADALTIGRLYFDLLPRTPGHPLTEAVLAALSDRRAVLGMLREAGMQPRLLKDEAGTTFIVLDGLDDAPDMSDTMKAAIRAAMTAPAEAPRGGLHAMH
ncbi:MAG: hypothetical protein ACM31D_04260 [Bacteroidota bacterium]